MIYIGYNFIKYMKMKDIDEMILSKDIKEDTKAHILRLYDRLIYYYEIYEELPRWRFINIYKDNKVYKYELKLDRTFDFIEENTYYKDKLLTSSILDMNELDYVI